MCRIPFKFPFAALVSHSPTGASAVAAAVSATAHHAAATGLHDPHLGGVASGNVGPNGHDITGQSHLFGSLIFFVFVCLLFV